MFNNNIVKDIAKVITSLLFLGKKKGQAIKVITLKYGLLR